MFFFLDFVVITIIIIIINCSCFLILWFDFFRSGNPPLMYPLPKHQLLPKLIVLLQPKKLLLVPILKLLLMVMVGKTPSFGKSLPLAPYYYCPYCYYPYWLNIFLPLVYIVGRRLSFCMGSSLLEALSDISFLNNTSTLCLYSSWHSIPWKSYFLEIPMVFHNCN